MRTIDESYAYSAEIVLPFKFGKLSSEFFSGANTNELLGSVTMYPRAPKIKSKGGYFNLMIYFSKKIFSNTGFGYTKNDYSSLIDYDFLRNRQKYINLWYSFTTNLFAACEYYNLRSDMYFQNSVYDLKSNRCQFSLFYMF